jgi:hypothetical protein
MVYFKRQIKTVQGMATVATSHLKILPLLFSVGYLLIFSRSYALKTIDKNADAGMRLRLSSLASPIARIVRYCTGTAVSTVRVYMLNL